MIRLFIALEIPDDIKDRIYHLLSEITEYSSDYRWEPKEKIHLTLKFIGDVKDELLPEVINEVEFVKGFYAFNCTISEFGFFFRYKEAKILWCDFQTDRSLFSIVDELNERLKKIGVEVEKREFKGHLTLLRIKKKVSDNFIKRFKEYKFDPIHFNTNKIALIQSLLKPTGSEYKVLKIYELK